MSAAFEGAPRKGLPSRAVRYALLIRLHRPIGIFLLLWPALWALWAAAGGMPPPVLVAVFVCGCVLMRSAGCVINDCLDLRFDRQVARTKGRPLACGLVSLREAGAVFGTLVLLSALLALSLSPPTILLAAAALFLACTYPLMKRCFRAPQLYLGLAFGWSIPMAYAEITHSIPPAAGLLFLANLCWTVGYDTLYAMADREDDARIGLHSTALLFGGQDRIAVAALQGAALILLAALGLSQGYRPVFYFCLALAALLALYQQYLVRERRPAMCIRAFANNGWLGAVVFCGFLANSWPLPAN